MVEETLDVFTQAQSEPERALAASRAKYRATEAALLIARQAVQLHGAIGFTDECDVGLYLNRALVVAARYGNASWHRQRLAALDAAAMHDGNGHGLGTVYSGEDSPDGAWSSLSDEDFRATVRAWFEANYPAEIRFFPRRLRWQEIKPWYLQLAAKGWVAPAWPVEHGGMGLSPSQLLIYIEQQERWGTGYGHSDGRTTLDQARHARAAGPVSATDPRRRTRLVPGLFRTQCRLRSGESAH